MPWLVKMVSPPKNHSYRHGFFPRSFHYKRDAVNLQQEVQRAGGKAVVEKNQKAGD